MRTLKRYIGRDVLLATLLVFGGLIALFAFFDLIHELGDVGRGDYTISRALLYVTLHLPSRLYELFPVAALIGTLFAIAQLVANSEYTVMRASGMSLARVAWSVLRVGLPLAAATFLAGHSSTPRLGVVGFCMGGQLALFAGTLNPSVGAVVNFYGIHPNVKPDYARLAGPVLGLFAEKDSFVSPQVARGVDAAIKAAGKSSEIHIYPNVDHAFFNDERPDAYDGAAAQDAWRRTLAFFRQHLR